MKPMPDKAEVALEYPDKLYIGTFEGSSQFETHWDETGVTLTLHQAGGADDRKTVRVHLRFRLLAEILQELAGHTEKMSKPGAGEERLLPAVEALNRALQRRVAAWKTIVEDESVKALSPKDEVSILHIME